MNEEWLKVFKKWNVFSKFILNAEILQIAVFATFVVTVVTLVFGAVLAGLTAHNTGGQVTWLLTIALVLFKLLLLEGFAVVMLFLMRLPIGIINSIEYLKGEWNDIMHHYKDEVRRFKKEIDKDE